MPKKKTSQTGTPALQTLQAANIDYQLFEYQHSTVMEHGYAKDTAEILGVSEDEVYKTLLVEVDGKPAVAVIPASHTLNFKRMAKALKGKHAQMMDPVKAQRLTGYVTGGISPLGQRTQYPTIIDSSALEQEKILISGGKRSLSVAVNPFDLVNLLNAGLENIID